MADPFTQFEHEGWERVADKYDSVWSGSTRQFIPPLLDAIDLSPRMSVLDVGCGPGYVSAAAVDRGAIPTGLDFPARWSRSPGKCFRRSLRPTPLLVATATSFVAPVASAINFV